MIKLEAREGELTLELETACEGYPGGSEIPETLDFAGGGELRSTTHLGTAGLSVAIGREVQLSQQMDSRGVVVSDNQPKLEPPKNVIHKPAPLVVLTSLITVLGGQCSSTGALITE